MPSPLIYAHLGHWHLGREPWGISSSLSPLDYGRAIDAPIGHLLDELGFRPLPSTLPHG